MGEILVEIIVHHLSFMRYSWGYSWATHGALGMTLLVGTCHFWGVPCCYGTSLAENAGEP